MLTGVDNLLVNTGIKPNEPKRPAVEGREPKLFREILAVQNEKLMSNEPAAQLLTEPEQVQELSLLAESGNSKAALLNESTLSEFFKLKLNLAAEEVAAEKETGEAVQQSASNQELLAWVGNLGLKLPVLFSPELVVDKPGAESLVEGVNPITITGLTAAQGENPLELVDLGRQKTSSAEEKTKEALPIPAMLTEKLSPQEAAVGLEKLINSLGEQEQRSTSLISTKPEVAESVLLMPVISGEQLVKSVALREYQAGENNKKSVGLVGRSNYWSDLGISELKLGDSRSKLFDSTLVAPLVKVKVAPDVLVENEIGLADLAKLSGGSEKTDGLIELAKEFAVPLVQSEAAAPKETGVDYNLVFSEQLAKMETAMAEVGAQQLENVEQVDTKELFPQIIDRAKLMAAGGLHEMEVNLQPEHLGKLQLKISMENQVVTAHFLAESERVKEIIETNLNQLRQKLYEAGLQIDQLQVNLGGQGSSGYQQSTYAGADYFGNRTKQVNKVMPIEANSLESLASPKAWSTGAIDFIA